MSENETSLDFISIMNQISDSGISRGLYERIAHEFPNFMNLPSSYVLQLLWYFVKFEGSAIYTNEIRNYLKIHDETLFMEYGSRFRNCLGVWEVFGIQPVNVKEYDFKVDPEKVEIKPKTYGNPKERRCEDRRVRRQAKIQAVKAHKDRVERDTERKKKNEEIERMIRRQNL